MMELLAPAGDRSALEAAVRAGADAVYLGLNVLNARRTAGNFDGEGLKRACDHCHERDVRVHVTVNTLVREDELEQLELVARQIACAGADAVIVQDLGAAAALKKMLPGLSLHASTQLAVHNRQGVAWCRGAGFDRVVLAREMTFEEIERCAPEGLELEAFGHGALCTACSGQCLFSSVVGGRSGNRGLCAQPCRLPYRLQGPACDASGDLISPKDLMAIRDLRRLEQAGVRSVKLEGRLKGADYVFAVTRAYRMALDGEAVDERALRGVFNRGYTRGYGPGIRDAEMLQNPGEKHIEQNTVAPEGDARRWVSLCARLRLYAGEPARLFLSDGVNQVEKLGETAETARGAGLNENRVAQQMEKTGGTPYKIEQMRLELGEGAYLPVSALNALRRGALEALGVMRAERGRGVDRIVGAMPPVADMPDYAGATRLCVESCDLALLEQMTDADEKVYAPRDLTRLPALSAPVTLRVPPVAPDRDLTVLNEWAWTQSAFIEGVILENVGHMALSWPGERRAGHFLNAANRQARGVLDMPYAPSVELTAREIRALDGEKELIVYGRLTLMHLRHCPLNGALGGGAHAACARCEPDGAAIRAHGLIDRKGVRFPLDRVRTSAGCVVRVLNSVPLMLLRRLDALPRAARWRLILTDEDEQSALRVVHLHRMALNGEDFKDTADWRALDARPGTTGHYFRGVE